VTDQIIFKICPRADWQAAIERGVYEGSGDDRRDGFLHFSTRHQLDGTAAKYFAGQSDLVLVEVAVGPLAAHLRWESSRDGELFPHLYAPLPLTAVLRVEPFVPAPRSDG
jgi:uncharacterized protein (DUF952 family)